MKRILLICLAFCCLCLTAFAQGEEREYRLTQDGSNFSFDMTEGELTFWEAPQLTTGQSREGGVITLRNETDRFVDFTLVSVSLPYGDQNALTYLDGVSLVIREGDTVLYHGPFTRLMDEDRAPIRFENVEPGGVRQLSLSAFCAYTYTGAVPAYQSLVWTFAPEIGPLPTTPVTQPPADPFEGVGHFDWKPVVLAAGGVAALTALIGVIRWILLKIRK